MSVPRRALPDAPARRGWCPGLRRPMPTGDGLLARVHPPLGVLTPAQARAVADGARRFGNGHIDVTARANLQVRGVRETTREPLARLLEAVGLGDTRADGGPQRLTLTGPLAGRDPGEMIDVPGLARAIEAAGRAIPGLPAKTLVAVAGRPGPTMADADVSVRMTEHGEVAIAVADEEPGNAVTCPVDDAAPAVAALLAAFARTGRRRARDLSNDERAVVVSAWHAASIAPPPLPVGEGGPIGPLHVSEGRERGSARRPDGARMPPPVRERDRVRGATSPEGPDSSPRPSAMRERGPVAVRAIRPDPSLPSPLSLRGVPSPAEGGGSARGRARAAPVIPQPGVTPLETGGAILAVDAPFGRCTSDALDRLAVIAVDLGADVIRISPARGFVLIAADADRARTHLATLAADFVIAPDDPRRAVAACTGAPACAAGSTPTLADAARLAEAFRPLAAHGFVAHVSGCAKGCARPGPADLTLVGQDGVYGIVVGGGPADAPVLRLPIEAALERLGRADIDGLAAAFAPDGGAVAAERGRYRRPA